MAPPTLPALDALHPMPKPKVAEWRKSLAAFGEESKGYGYGAAALGAQAFNLPSVRGKAIEGYQKSMEAAVAGWKAPLTPKVEDVKLDEPGGLERAGQYIGYQAPKGLATLASYAALGGVGGLVGKGLTKKAVKDVAKAYTKKNLTAAGSRGLGADATAIAAKEKIVPAALGEAALAKIRANAVAGGYTAATAGAFGLEGGGSFGEMVAEGVDPEKAFGPAAVGGAISAGLEMAPVGAAAKYLGVDDWVKRGFAKTVKQGAREVIKKDPGLAAKAVELAKKVAKGSAAGVAVEGTTEGLQELVAIGAKRWATDNPLFAGLDEDEKSAVLNAVVAGGLVGGLAGGAIGPFRAGGESTYVEEDRVEQPDDKAEESTEAAQQPEVGGVDTPPPPVVEPETSAEEVAAAAAVEAAPVREEAAPVERPLSQREEAAPVREEISRQARWEKFLTQEGVAEQDLDEPRAQEFRAKFELLEETRASEQEVVRGDAEERSYSAKTDEIVSNTFKEAVTPEVVSSAAAPAQADAATPPQGPVWSNKTTGTYVNQVGPSNFAVHEADGAHLGYEPSLEAAKDFAVSYDEFATQPEAVAQPPSSDEWEQASPAKWIEPEQFDSDTGELVGKGYEIEKVGDEFIVFDPVGNMLGSKNTLEVAKEAVEADKKLEENLNTVPEWAEFDSPKGPVLVDKEGYGIVEEDSGSYAISDLAGNILGHTDSFESAKKFVEKYKQDLVFGAPAPAEVTPPVEENWAAPEVPSGYEIASSELTLPTGKALYLSSMPFESRVEIAHIHNDILNTKMPLGEKIQAYKSVPTTKTELEAYKTAHPYKFKKEDIADYVTEAEAGPALIRITHDQQKYTLDDVLEQHTKYIDKFGKQSYETMLAQTPAETKEAPSLVGWMQDMESEQNLLARNPHEDIWAGLPTVGNNSTRYGLVVINPNTRKVLLRRVANDYEGLVWDVSRGGATRNPKYETQTIPTILGSTTADVMEHPLLAAKREAKEELGVDTTVIGQLATPFYSGSGQMPSVYYIAVVKGDVDSNFTSEETSGITWASYQDAVKLVSTTSELSADPKMKRPEPGNYHTRQRSARIRRTIRAVFDKDKQKSGLSYKGNDTALHHYHRKTLIKDYPSESKLAAKPFKTLTATQNLRLASLFWAKQKYINHTPEARLLAGMQEFSRRKAALNNWLKEKTGSDITASKIKGSGANPNTFTQEPGKLNPVAIELYNSSPSLEGLHGDYIDPAYFGTGTKGADTEHGMYFATTPTKAAKFNSGRVNKYILAFKNLKVVPWNKHYASNLFADQMQIAKEEGHDGLVFTNVSDNAQGHQYVIWGADQIIASSADGVGFTGKTIYQSLAGQAERVPTKATAVGIIDDTFGVGFAEQLVGEGRLELVEGYTPSQAAGEYDPASDTMRVYLNNVDEADLVGVLLHEGRHARLETIVGDGVKKYHSDLLGMSDETAKRALEQTSLAGRERFGLVGTQEDVRKQLAQLDPAFLVQEDLANYIQFAQKKPTALFHRIVAAIKAWWATSELGKLYHIKLDDAMAVALGVRAVKAALADPAGSVQEAQRKYYAFTAHASKSEFEIPKVYYVLRGKGEGYISFGYGIYTLEGMPTLSYYKKGIGQREYGYETPDDVLPLMLEYDRPLGHQRQDVQAMLRDPTEGHLLMRAAQQALSKPGRYPGSVKVDTLGTGGALYDALVEYYLDTKYSGSYGHVYDAELKKKVSRRNLARRDASRFLNKVGIRGIHYLDEGSRRLRVIRSGPDTYRFVLGHGSGGAKHSGDLSLAELAAQTNSETASKAKELEVGGSFDDAGFGHYNWVWWNQNDLDRFRLTHKDKKVVGSPEYTASYDLNVAGHAVGEKRFLEDYVIHPFSGEYQFTAEKEAEVKKKYGFYYSTGTPSVVKGVEQTRADIQAGFTDDWFARAEQEGIVEVLDEAHSDGATASFSLDDGKIRVYAGSQEENSAAAVAHELVHSSLETYLGSTQQLAKDIQSRKDAYSAAAAERAKLSVEMYLNNGGDPQFASQVLQEELVAHYTQLAFANQPTGQARRVINGVKAGWLASPVGKFLGTFGLRPQMTDGLAVELARRAADYRLELRDTLKELVPAARKLQALGQVESIDALGSALEVRNEELYTIPLMAGDFWWNKDLSHSIDETNRPGLLNKLYYQMVDSFADMGKKSPEAYSAFNLAKSKKTSQVTDVYTNIIKPWVDKSVQLADQLGVSVEDLNDGFAGWHIVEDKVNRQLAATNALPYAKELIAQVQKAEQQYEKTDPVRIQLRSARLEMQKGISNLRKRLTWEGHTPVDDSNQPRVMSNAEIRWELKKKLDEFYLRPIGEKKLWQLNEWLQAEAVTWEALKNHGAGLATPEERGQDPELNAQLDTLLSLGQQPINAHEVYNRFKDNPLFQGLAKQAQLVAKQARDALATSGLISQEEAMAMGQAYKHWMPLRREMYDFDTVLQQRLEGTGQPMVRAGMPSVSKPVHTMQNLFANLDVVISAAEQNIAKEFLARDVEQDETRWANWFTVSQDKSEKKNKDPFGFVQTARSKVDVNDISFFREGERWFIHGEPSNQRAQYLVRAIKNLDAKQQGPFMQVLSWVNKWIRWVNISASPAFLLTNIPRDIGTAMLNLKATEIGEHAGELKKELLPAAKALRAHFFRGEEDADIKAWQDAGGRISFVESLQANDEGWQSLEAKIKHRQGELVVPGFGVQKLGKATGTALGWGRTKLEQMELTNIVAENISRYATWRVAKAHGLSDAKAAMLSKDITTNFDRGGLQKQVLSTWWLFYNATVQGNAQVVRNLLHGPNKQKLISALGMVIGAAFVNDQLGAALSGDEDEDGRLDWDSYPEWEKEKFARLATLGFLFEGEVKLPLPWVFNVFWRMGEIASESTRGQIDPVDGAQQLSAMILNTFNPISSSESTFLQTVSPTAFDPLVQIAENTSAFGRPLGPQKYPGQEFVPDSQIAWMGTPDGYKDLARFVNEMLGGSAAESGLVDLRPSTYKVLADAVMGGGGRFAGSFLSSIADPPPPQDWPGLKIFYTAPTDPIEASLYHERQAKVEQAVKAEKVFRAGPQRDLAELQRIRREYAGELRMVDTAKDAERQVRDLRQQLKTAQVRGVQSRVDTIKGQINKAQTRFNQSWVRRVTN